MLKKYHGIIPPIITPVDARENVDESGYRQLLEYCVQGGLHGILVAGTNGSRWNRSMAAFPLWQAAWTPVPAASSRTSRRRRTWV